MRSARWMAMILASALLAVLSAAGAADAATITPEPAAYQLIADTAHGHLFISEGTSPGYEPYPTDSTILVTDLSGDPVATLPGPLGVAGMTLSPDDTTLYVAQDGGVAAYSTATLQQTNFYSIGFPAYSVAVQSGQLWVTYAQAGLSFTIGSIDPVNRLIRRDACPHELGSVSAADLRRPGWRERHPGDVERGR